MLAGSSASRQHHHGISWSAILSRKLSRWRRRSSGPCGWRTHAHQIADHPSRHRYNAAVAPECDAATVHRQEARSHSIAVSICTWLRPSATGMAAWRSSNSARQEPAACRCRLQRQVRHGLLERLVRTRSVVVDDIDDVIDFIEHFHHDGDLADQRIGARAARAGAMPLLSIDWSFPVSRTSR